MRFNTPLAGQSFVIKSDGTLSDIVFVTDMQGQHDWTWTVRWRRFQKSGTLSTPNNTANLSIYLTDLGGQLTVTVRSGRGSATMKVKIIGTNPSLAEVTTYLATRPGGKDFTPIALHEANGRHFSSKGEPIASFDGGYGIIQLTNPIPTYQQVWSWKRNLDAGLALFAVKRTAAIRYLSQSGRSYTPDQLRLEAISRWNGGAYHRWDGRAWLRNPDMICIPGTGNLGWDITDSANQGQTMQQLLARDQERVNRPPRRGIDHYRYSGICYADRIVSR